ncbi:MAG: molybdopterin-dependent oxidoreductase [Firmicutes bacterium]|nr:molybdopterin-dependent oxidoreductase [Bacillota bacterium]
MSKAKPVTREDVWIPSVCNMCYNSCRIRVHRVDGTIVGIEGQPGNPHNDTRLCGKGMAGLMSCYNPYRITRPLKRTNPQKGLGVDPRFVEISWDEAMDTITTKLKEVRAKDPRSLLVTSFDVHVMSTYIYAWFVAFGSNNFTAGAPGWFCGNGIHPISWLFHGSFYPSPDWENCRYVMLFGTQKGHGMHLNPVYDAYKVANAKARGMHLVVVDPLLSQAAAGAQEWVPLRPGTDAAFAVGIVNQLLNEVGIYDREFIRRHTNGPYLIAPDGKYLRNEEGKPLVWDPGAGRARPFHEADEFTAAIEGAYEVNGVRCRTGFQILKDHVRSYTPEKVSKITTIPAETVRRVAREIGEAANIGGTITIDGVELPYRPVAVCYNRGAVAHKHGMVNALAIQLINVVLGAVDVPGSEMGILAAGPGWNPEADEDGMLIPSPVAAFMGVPYPLRKAPEKTVIQSLEVKELFPMSNGSRPMLLETMINPEKYKLPYKLEFLIHSRNNIMMTSANPKKVAEALAKVPFQLSFALTVDETVEFADIVLPETHYLESLVALPERVGLNKVVGTGTWCYAVRQPVLDPPGEARNWHEVLFELSDRVGFREEFNKLLDAYLSFKGEWALEPKKSYTVEEFADHFLMARLGRQNGLETMKEKGFVTQGKTVQEAFPRPFTRGRMPIYVETFVVAAERIRKQAEEVGFDFMETDDYQPVPDWKPCQPAADLKPECDLWVINYKMPYHTFSFSMENPWLSEITDYYPHHRGIIINAETAGKKGLADGDLVWLESTAGLRVKGRVCLRQGIHPEVVAVAGVQGQWGRGRPPHARGKGVHFNSLIDHNLKNVDYASGGLDSCVKVKVIKAE